MKFVTVLQHYSVQRNFPKAETPTPSIPVKALFPSSTIVAQSLSCLLANYHGICYRLYTRKTCDHHRKRVNIIYRRNLVNNVTSQEVCQGRLTCKYLICQP